MSGRPIYNQIVQTGREFFAKLERSVWGDIGAILGNASFD